MLAQKGHAVIVVAEGAGEDVLGRSAQVDAGGNRKLPELGLWLKEQIGAYFKEAGKPTTVKYIDPSYMIRSVPANASDSIYCELLAQNVVHGAMVRAQPPSYPRAGHGESALLTRAPRRAAAAAAGRRGTRPSRWACATTGSSTSRSTRWSKTRRGRWTRAASRGSA